MRKALNRDFALLKNIESDLEFDSAFDVLFGNKSIRERYFAANIFSTNLNQVFRNQEIVNIEDINFELRWNFKIISKYSNEINDFFVLKEQYDAYAFEGHYQAAADTLHSIECKYGVSFWLLENKIYISHKMGFNIANNINNKINDEIILTILNFYNMKASDEISARDYKYIATNAAETFKHNFPNHEALLDWYKYFTAPFIFKMTYRSICNLLKCVCNLPLIDRYLILLDIIGEYIVNPVEGVSIEWVKNNSDRLSCFKDTRMTTYRFILSDRKERLSNFVIDDQLLKIKNEFIKGKVEESYDLLKEWIEVNTVDINAIKSFVVLGHLCKKNTEEISLSKNKKTVISSLDDIYYVTEGYNESIETINKMVISNFHAKWTRDLSNYVSSYVQPLDSENRKVAIKTSNMQELTMETVAENLEKEEALDFLTNLSIEEGEEYKKYLISIIREDYKDAGEICKVQQLSELLFLRDLNIFENYEKYINNSNLTMNKIMCSKLLWNSMRKNDDYEKGIDYFIHLFINRTEYVRFVPMDKFIQYILHNKDVNIGHIRVPIMLYIYATYFDPNSKEELSIACEDFFDANNIERPSIIKELGSNSNQEQLVFFLKEICIPQIMGPVLLTIRTTKELEQERICICQMLRNMDPQNEEYYDKEIEERTRKLFLNDGVSSLETYKIQVNTDGIKERIIKNQKSAFNQYMYSCNAKVDQFVELIKNMQTSSEQVSYFSFESGRIISEIIKTIRNEFVLGPEYGLDTYLSVNIRHGVLAAQLRAPLVKMSLYAEKKVELNDYDVSDRWMFNLRNDRDRSQAKKAIIAFTEETDRIIEYLKKDLIQISTEEKKSNGVFDYTLGEEHIRYLLTFLTGDCEFEEFIDAVFSFLWNRTDINLQRMQDIIRDDIKNKYSAVFGKLKEVFGGLSVDFPEANQWIKEAQNDMDASLEKVCDWFRRVSMRQSQDFNLDSALQVGLETIKNIHPGTVFEVHYNCVDLSEKIKGGTWKYYASIFGILFDNISKYAKEENGIKHIECELRSDNKGIYIKMENLVKDINEQIKNRIETAMEVISTGDYLALAKQEGGSGIPKIKKILAIDLDLKPNVEFEIIEGLDIFKIEIEGNYK